MGIDRQAEFSYAEENSSEMHIWMEKINLFSEPKRFVELPKPVQMALVTLIAAWLAHFSFLFFVFSAQLSQNMLIQHLGLALLSCFILAKLKN